MGMCRYMVTKYKKNGIWIWLFCCKVKELLSFFYFLVKYICCLLQIYPNISKLCSLHLVAPSSSAVVSWSLTGELLPPAVYVNYLLISTTKKWMEIIHILLYRNNGFVIAKSVIQPLLIIYGSLGLRCFQKQLSIWILISSSETSIRHCASARSGV